jgi:hypothetical protein
MRLYGLFGESGIKGVFFSFSLFWWLAICCSALAFSFSVFSDVGFLYFSSGCSGF